MRLHYLQHVWFEDLGCIKELAEENGVDIASTRLYNNEILPALDDFDWLVIMGGPMGVKDEDEYSWLAEEKTLIKGAIEKGKTVLGICLGAQLIAEALGANVYKNKKKEIGWFPVKNLNKEAELLNDIPDELTVFHWHGDTFDIPGGAVSLFASEACKNQAFSYDGARVLALQFHVEMTSKGIERIVKECAHELKEDEFIQSREYILGQTKKNNLCNRYLELLLKKQRKELMK